MNNLTEEEIEFDVNSGFDENSFDESLDERMKILTKVLLIKVLTKWVRALHRAFNHVK